MTIFIRENAFGLQASIKFFPASIDGWTQWPLEDVAVILTHYGLVTPYGDRNLGQQ